MVVALIPVQMQKGLNSDLALWKDCGIINIRQKIHHEKQRRVSPLRYNRH